MTLNSGFRLQCSLQGEQRFCKITFSVWDGKKGTGDLHDLSHYVMLTDVLRCPANTGSNFA